MYRILDYKKIYEQVQGQATESTLKVSLKPKDLTSALSATDIANAQSIFARDENGKEYTVKIYKDPKNIMEAPGEYSQNPAQKFIFPVNDNIAKDLLAKSGKGETVTTGLLRSVDDPNKYGVVAPNVAVKLEITLVGEHGTQSSPTAEDQAVKSKAEEYPDVPTETLKSSQTPNESAKPISNETKPQSSGVMNFDQFAMTEKKQWIKDIDMKKGALKKELGKEKITKSDIAKEESKLKKKDKDKEKPGLQLNKKDAKKHKRLTLAKNLMKMHESVVEKYENASSISEIKECLVELHKVVEDMMKKTAAPKKEKKND